MLSYEFLTIQNRFTKPYLQKWGKNCAMFNQETYCRINMFFQLSTQWRSNYSWVFSTNNSHIWEQCSDSIPNRFIPTPPHRHPGGVATPSVRTVNTDSTCSRNCSCLVCLTSLSVNGKLFKLKKRNLTKSTRFSCDSLVDKHPGNKFRLSCLQWHRKVPLKAEARGGLLCDTDCSHHSQDWRRCRPGCPEPFQHNGGTNRHLIQAKPYQQFPEWPLFLKEIFHFELIWFPQQP